MKIHWNGLTKATPVSNSVDVYRVYEDSVETVWVHKPDHPLYRLDAEWSFDRVHQTLIDREMNWHKVDGDFRSLFQGGTIEVNVAMYRYRY